MLVAITAVTIGSVEQGWHAVVLLGRARSHALPLAWGCAARIEWGDARDLEDRLKSLIELDDELFPPALDDKLFPHAELALVEPSRRAAAQPVPKRYAVRRTRKTRTAPDPFTMFLEHTVEPSALLLLAGVEAQLQSTTHARDSQTV